MKKKLIRILVLLMALLAAVIVWWCVKPSLDAPEFRPVGIPPQITPYRYIFYDFLAANPFEGGKMWINVMSQTKSNHCYLYDIERQTVLGELFRGDPVFTMGNGSKLLCAQRLSPGSAGRPLLGRVSRFFPFSKRSPRSASDWEVIWVLDLKRNHAVNIGRIPQLAGAGSTTVPAPGFRFGYNKPTGSPNSEFFVFDLEKERSLRVAVGGQQAIYPVAWWDEKTIVIKTANGDFLLYDVATAETKPFLSAGQLADFFAKAGIAEDSTNANGIASWNGNGYNLFLTDTHKRWLAEESFLIQIEPAGATLKLISPKFWFGWSDRLDAATRHYIYSGREPGAGSSGVFLRDLESNTEQMLVAADGGKQFSTPRFYNEGVIYTRNQMLWWINLNGADLKRVFPPPDAGP
jgi:hypothetical protein